MVVRTYFDKNNTLIYNDITNTGKNPVAELFYGGDVSSPQYSRFIFHFDESRLRELSECNFPDLSKLKHTLRMTNTGSFDRELLGGSTCGGKARACSFDLQVYTLDQHFDEGNGYDYGSCGYYAGCGSSSSCPSNWIYAMTNTPWSGGAGTYSGTPAEIIAIQHFEEGNENINIDITDYVNEVLTGRTNYGLGISFPLLFEQTPTNELQYVGFFTRHTQFFYEPYIETVLTETIMDDRANFYLDKVNNLYLYVNVGGQPTNLDKIPDVIIYDHMGEVFSAISSSAVTHVTCGVYSVQLKIPSGLYQDCMQFTDIWSGITLNGMNMPDVEMDFVLKSSSDYFNIGNNDELPKEYGFSVSGIRRDEKIQRGDIRKVIVYAKIPYTINQSVLLDNLEYRIYVREGKNEYNVIDYQPVNKAFNNNYFLLDTASLIPNTYYMDIKAKSNMGVRTIKDVISFDIVSQSELRDSQ